MSATEQVRFRCPDCNKLLCVPAERADKRVKCPGCGHAFRPPTPQAPPPRQSPEPQPPVPEPPPEIRPPEPSPPGEGPQRLAQLTEALDEKGKAALPVLMNEFSATGSAHFGRLLALMTDEEVGKLAKTINALGPKLVPAFAKLIETTPPEQFVSTMRQPTQSRVAGGAGNAVGGCIHVVIGIVFIAGGLAGKLVLKGTNSGVALAVVGVLIVLYGLAKIFGSEG